MLLCFLTKSLVLPVFPALQQDLEVELGYYTVFKKGLTGLFHIQDRSGAGGERAGLSGLYVCVVHPAPTISAWEDYKQV